MKRLLGAAMFVAVAAHAQVPVTTVAQQGIPAGSIFAGQTPAGFLNIGNDIWFGDEAQGWRHYKPVDPTDPTPLETQFWQFDINPTFSEGGGICIPFCSVGQIVKQDDFNVYVAAWDHAKGQPGQVGGGGIYRMALGSAAFTISTGSFIVQGLTPLAPTKGLAGNQPTSIARGPDGKLYFGNLKNPNLQRITNPFAADTTTQVVEAVGTAANGKPIFSMAFNGADLYVGTGDGFYVVPNIAACFGNAGNCGTPRLIFGGAPVNAVAADGQGHVVFTFNSGGFVKRYTPLDEAIVDIASGFKFVAGHTNGLGFDRDGNLWIGDNPAAEGTPFGGRLSRVLAADLAAVP